jgi:putative copper resistance protein D
MDLLIDVFGYTSVVLRGLTIIAQSVAIGGILFLVLLARPLMMELGYAGERVLGTTARVAAYAAVGLTVCEGASVALQATMLADTIKLGFTDSIGTDSAGAGIVDALAASLMAILLLTHGVHRRLWPLLPLALIELSTGTITTHAFSRMENRMPLMLADGLHQFGAALWIGGIPCFLLTLAHVPNGRPRLFVGARFSLMSIAGVACILASGTVMGLFYLGDFQNFYGTTYGVMVAAKISLFLLLLGLGGSNFLVVRGLREDPSGPVTRLTRFAEAELGIG